MKMILNKTLKRCLWIVLVIILISAGLVTKKWYEARKLEKAIEQSYKDLEELSEFLEKDREKIKKECDRLLN